MRTAGALSACAGLAAAAAVKDARQGGLGDDLDVAAAEDLVGLYKALGGGWETGKAGAG
jgi:hypothetical protein